MWGQSRLEGDFHFISGPVKDAQNRQGGGKGNLKERENRGGKEKKEISTKKKRVWERRCNLKCNWPFIGTLRDVKWGEVAAARKRRAPGGPGQSGKGIFIQQRKRGGRSCSAKRWASRSRVRVSGEGRDKWGGLRRGKGNKKGRPKANR